jgi:hypothetical protein
MALAVAVALWASLVSLPPELRSVTALASATSQQLELQPAMQEAAQPADVLVV